MLQKAIDEHQINKNDSEGNLIEKVKINQKELQGSGKIIPTYELIKGFESEYPEIDFYFVEEKNSTILPPKTKEQEEREMREFNVLIQKLTDKLFGNNEEIELDIEKILNS